MNTLGAMQKGIQIIGAELANLLTCPFNVQFDDADMLLMDASKILVKQGVLFNPKTTVIIILTDNHSPEQ